MKENSVRWKIQVNRFRRAEHVVRSGDQHLIKALHYDRPEGRRSVG